MNFEISGHLVVYMIKKFVFRTILISILIGVGTAYIGVLTNENTYSSSGELVQNDNNYSLIASYQQFVSSKRFNNLLNNEVQKSRWKDYSHNKNYSVEIESSGSASTPFFTLSATSSNAKYAEFLTEKSITIFVSSIGKYLSGANITVVSDASQASKKSLKPRILKWFMYGFIVTLIVSSSICIIGFLFIGKVKEDTFIENVFNEKNLGTIEISEVKK